LNADAEAAAMEVRAELAGFRLPAHRGDDALADDDRADVSALRLGDVLLENDVLAHRPEGLEQRRHSLWRFGDHRTDALCALLELHDCRTAADQLQRKPDGVRGSRAHGRRNVD